LPRREARLCVGFRPGAPGFGAFRGFNRGFFGRTKFFFVGQKIFFAPKKTQKIEKNAFFSLFLILCRIFWLFLAIIPFFWQILDFSRFFPPARPRTPRKGLLTKILAGFIIPSNC
jgi:hypothetical protein